MSESMDRRSRLSIAPVVIDLELKLRTSAFALFGVVPPAEIDRIEKMADDAADLLDRILGRD